MSDQVPSNNDSDFADSSSWEVISEKSSSSIENIPEYEYDTSNPEIQSNDNELEHIFIDIEENVGDKNVDDHISTNKCPVDKKDKSRFFPKPDWKKLKYRVEKGFRPPEKCTAILILASILTITGLTLLCGLFPTQSSKSSLEIIQNDYLKVIDGDTKYLRDAFNKTSEILDKINVSNYYNATSTYDDDVCVEDEYPIEDGTSKIDFPFIIDYPENSVFEPSTSSVYDCNFEDLQNISTTGVLDNIKNMCSNPRIQLFLCSIMQDVCLIKLIQHLERRHAKPETTNETPIQSDKKLKTKKVTKPKTTTKLKSRLTESKNKTDKRKEKKPTPLGQECFNLFGGPTNPNIDELLNITQDALGQENGKSECERRFEDLESKCQSVGKNHRQKLQEIRNDFKTKISQMKGQEKQSWLRRQKIKLIREKYVQKLKTDKENYLMQLKKIKEERQAVLSDICHKKEVISQARDASVGNFGIFVPEFNFENELRKIRGAETYNVNKNVSKARTDSSKLSKYKRKVSKTEHINETVSQKPNELVYMQSVIPKIITTLNGSIDDRTSEISRDRSKISLPSTKTRKKVTKKEPKSVENSLLLSNFTSQLEDLDREHSYLPTVSRAPKDRTVNGTKRTQFEDNLSTMFSKDSIVPIASKSRTTSFSTSALQSPAAILCLSDKTPDENNTIASPEVIAIEPAAGSSSFSQISLPKTSSSPFEPPENSALVKISEAVDIQKPSDTCTRGLNESYSFLPISQRAFPLSFNMTKKEDAPRNASGRHHELDPSIPKPVTYISFVRMPKKKTDLSQRVGDYQIQPSTPGKLDENARRSDDWSTIDETIPDSEVDSQNKIENDLKLALKETLKKHNLYHLLFDSKGEKIMKEEEMLENKHKKLPSTPQTPMISKHDPKLTKKLYMFKGRL